jgi:hypothetical protein
MPFEKSGQRKQSFSSEEGDRVVVLLEPPSQKIAIIKAVRNCTDLGLKDAKELVERAPTPLLAYVTSSQADILYRQLIEAGASASVDLAERFSESDLAGIARRFELRAPATGCLGVGAGVLLLVALLSLVI